MRRREFAAQVWSKLVAFDKRHALLPAGARVLAGVSGGPDSVALAHWLSVQKRRKGLDVALLHVHHGLRGRAADRDAAFVLELGRKLGLPASVAKADVKGLARRRRSGLEDAGRKARYDALAKAAKRGRRSVVCVGHQLDDQAETVLLHALRGTSLAGLGAMAPVRPLAPGVALARPLLPLTRREVMAYLKVHGLDWREDASNASEAFERNWVRRRLLPLLERRRPGAAQRLAAMAEQVRAALPRG
jgi:tRNA(Ile)-lysidine synthase